MSESRIKLVKTAALCYAFLVLGISATIVGPTLLDLKQQLSASLTTVSYIVTVRAVGFASGSVFSGFMDMRVNFLLSTCTAFFCSSACTLSVPFWTAIWQLLPIVFFDGFCLGFFETSGNVFMLFMWGKDAVSYIQAMHFMNGVGAIIAPLMAQPFLVEKNETVENRIKMMNTSLDLDPDGDPQEVRLIYPFSILSSILLSTGVSFLCLYIFYPETEEHESRMKTEESMKHEANRRRDSIETDVLLIKSKNKKFVKVLFIFLAMMYMFSLMGTETCLLSYITTYAVKSDLHLSKTTGTRLTALFSTMFTISIIPAVIMTRWFSNKMCILIELFILMTGSSLMFAFGNESAVMLAVGIGITGIGISSIYGFLFGYMEDLFPVTNVMGSLIAVSAMTGESGLPLVVSLFIESFPNILLWVMIVGSTILTADFLLMVSFAERYLIHTQ